VWALLGYRLGWSMQHPVRRAATAQVDAIAATPGSVWIAAGGLVM
jgi:hypothetical protein